MNKTSLSKASSWCPVPISLIDEIMPRLRDTELRVLLVVLRQTAGWKGDRTQETIKETTKKVLTETERRAITKNRAAAKRRDWISHRQLCQRTGRGSDAVSAAVASLTASGLIIVEDASGRPLRTPEERRRCLGRLYFRLGNI